MNIFIVQLGNRKMVIAAFLRELILWLFCLIKNTEAIELTMKTLKSPSFVFKHRYFGLCRTIIVVYFPHDLASWVQGVALCSDRSPLQRDSLGRLTLLIGRVSGLIARPRPSCGALSARVVSTAPASDGRGRRESVCTERRGGERGGRALWRRVEVGVQSSTGRPKPRVV